MSTTHRISSVSVIGLPLRRQGDRLSLTLDLRSWWVIAAASLCLVLLIAAVVAANLSASLTWQIRDTRTELTKLTDARTQLVARMSALDDRERLLGLAEQAGMRAAQSVLYLVEDGPHTAAR